MSSQTYEMLWDCQFCGQEKNLGKTHRFCPNCGAPQDPKARYFPADDEKVAVEDHEYVGADIVCPSCASVSSSAAVHCGNCGTPLEGAEKVSTLASESRSQHASFAQSGSGDVTLKEFESEMGRVGLRGDESSSGNRKWLIIGIVAAVVIVIGVLAFLFTRTTEKTVTVTGHTWERSIQIESFGPQSDSSWDEQVPNDAYSMSCSERQRDTRRVEDGQECRTVRRDQGDGTFRESQECTTRYREEPIYDDWCSYTVDRWDESHAITSDGTGLVQAPFWGNLDLNCPGIAQNGCEREAGRNERYIVFFKADDDNRYECTFDKEKWEAITVESVWNVEIRSIGDSIQCDSLVESR